MSGGSGTGTPVIPVTPADEPITLVEAKLHLKVITDPGDTAAHPQDGEVARMISAARQAAEEFCERAFYVGPRSAIGAAFCLPLLSPVRAVLSVYYVDTAGAVQLLADTVYELNGTADALRPQAGQSWPTTALRPDAVRIAYTAGPDVADVPPLVKAAMMLTLGHLFENREDASTWETYALPIGSQSLLMPFRRGLGV